jgi:hypothetical protein
MSRGPERTPTRFCQRVRSARRALWRHQPDNIRSRAGRVLMFRPSFAASQAARSFVLLGNGVAESEATGMPMSLARLHVGMNHSTVAKTDAGGRRNRRAKDAPVDAPLSQVTTQSGRSNGRGSDGQSGLAIPDRQTHLRRLLFGGGDRQYAGHRSAQKGTTGNLGTLATHHPACLLRQP